jgi:hypothetical protein
MSLTFWIVIDPWYRKLCDTNIKSLFAPLLLSGASEKFCSCFFFFFFFLNIGSQEGLTNDILRWERERERG